MSRAEKIAKMATRTAVQAKEFICKEEKKKGKKWCFIRSTQTLCRMLYSNSIKL